MADNRTNKGVNRSSIGASKQTKPRAGDGTADLLAKQLNVENAKIEAEKKAEKDHPKEPANKPEYDPYHNRENPKEHHGYYYTVGPNGKPVRRRLRTGSGYEEADIKKQKGFSQLVSERMMSGQGIKESLKGGGKDLFGAYMTSLKKLKDPMNYLSKLPGGLGQMAATAYGMKTGRAKEDISYYTGIHAPPGMEQEEQSSGASNADGSTPTATKVKETKSTASKGTKAPAFPKVVARHIMKMSKDISEIRKDIKALVLQGKGKNSPSTLLEKIYNSLEKTSEKETKEKEISKELEDSKEQNTTEQLELSKDIEKSEKTEKSSKQSIFEKIKNLRKPKVANVGMAEGAEGAVGGLAEGAAAAGGAAAGASLAGGATAAGEGLLGGSALVAAAPWLLGAAAVGGVGYLGYKAYKGLSGEAEKSTKGSNPSGEVDQTYFQKSPGESDSDYQKRMTEYATKNNAQIASGEKTMPKGYDPKTGTQTNSVMVDKQTSINKNITNNTSTTKTTPVDDVIPDASKPIPITNITGDTSKASSVNNITGDTSKASSVNNITGDTSKASSVTNVDGDTSKSTPVSNIATKVTNITTESTNVNSDTSKASSVNKVAGDTSNTEVNRNNELTSNQSNVNTKNLASPVSNITKPSISKVNSSSINNISGDSQTSSQVMNDGDTTKLVAMLPDGTTAPISSIMNSSTTKLTTMAPSANKLSARATAATTENKNLTGPASDTANAPIIVNAPTVNNVGSKTGSVTSQGPTPIRNDEPVLTRVQYQNVRPV